VAGTTSARAEKRDLSLADALSLALANNGTLLVTREDAAIAGEEVALARAPYTPTLFAEVYTAREDQPGGAARFPWVARERGASAGVSGRLIQTGLHYQITFDLASGTYEDPFSAVYSPVHTSFLGVSLRQPLLRGAFGSGNRKIVAVASLRREQSKELLRAELERIVSSVQVAYWNLVRAHRERDARAASLKLAGEQLEESKRLARLGARAQLDVIEAEAGVSRRRQELEAANEGVIEAEAILRGLMQVQAGASGWEADTVIVPTDPPELVEVNTSLEHHLALARKNRPDVVAARLRAEAEAAALEVEANLRRPVLDLVASAGLHGLAGTLADSYATAGVNDPMGMSPPYFTDPALQGGLGTSLGNLMSRDYYSVYLGLRFELPLGTDEARARHAIQRRELAKARAERRAVMAQVENEVRASLGRLQASAAIVAAADEAVVLTERLLEGTRKRFRNDAATSFDVLRVLDELTRLKIEAARARARYQVALSRLEEANGTLLDRLGITVESLDRR